MSSSNPLESLAARVRRGDAGAGAELRRALEPALRVIARRAGRVGATNQTAPGLVGRGGTADGGVAAHACDVILDRLAPAPYPATFRPGYTV
jgi:acyl-coenzyme A thioesterase PaaI-like protein